MTPQRVIFEKFDDTDEDGEQMSQDVGLAFGVRAAEEHGAAGPWHSKGPRLFSEHHR